MKKFAIIFCVSLLSACMGETTYKSQVGNSVQFLRVKREGTKVTLLISVNKDMSDGAFLVHEDCVVMNENNWRCIQSTYGNIYEVKMINGVVSMSAGLSGTTEKYVPMGFFD